jgi:membrane protein implicated in regulation of membrane protease activity
MWWVWMALAGIFIMGEIFRRGSFFLWLGFGAAASGTLALLDIQTPGQIAVFINISGILILLERRFLERYTFNTPSKSSSSDDDIADSNVFRRAGAGWEINYGGKSYTVKHSKGLLHIRNLIIKKGEWIPCSVLKRLSSDEVSENKHEHYATMSREQLEAEDLRLDVGVPPEDIIERLPLDKIRKLRDALIERKAVDDFNGPEDKIDQLDTLDFIEQYLKKITNNKGRSRKIHDQTDTDRKAVSAAINRCRNNLKEHQELYTHFKSFIKAEGNAFRYLPDRPVDWKTD